MSLDEALYAIDDSSIDEVPDKMTLTELAHELRKIFRFKYLTAEAQLGKIVDYFEEETNG